MNVCFSAVTGIQYMHGFCTVTQYFFSTTNRAPQIDRPPQKKKPQSIYIPFHITIWIYTILFCSSVSLDFILWYKTILSVENIFGGYLTVFVVVVIRNIYIWSFSHDPLVLCGQENSYYIYGYLEQCFRSCKYLCWIMHVEWQHWLIHWLFHGVITLAHYNSCTADS